MKVGGDDGHPFDSARGYVCTACGKLCDAEPTPTCNKPMCANGCMIPQDCPENRSAQPTPTAVELAARIGETPWMRYIHADHAWQDANDLIRAGCAELRRLAAALAQADLVHHELETVLGMKCLSSQMPRFVAERLSAPAADATAGGEENPCSVAVEVSRYLLTGMHHATPEGRKAINEIIQRYTEAATKELREKQAAALEAQHVKSYKLGKADGHRDELATQELGGTIYHLRAEVTRLQKANKQAGDEALANCTRAEKAEAFLNDAHAARERAVADLATMTKAKEDADREGSAVCLDWTDRLDKSNALVEKLRGVLTDIRQRTELSGDLTIRRRVDEALALTADTQGGKK